MISSLISSLNKKLQAVEISSNRYRRSKKNTTCDYSDDVGKQSMEMKKKVEKRVRFAETEPAIIGIDGEVEETEKRGVRITVRLTKQEANRMLSRCSNGEFRDLASELLQIPAARVTSNLLAN